MGGPHWIDELADRLERRLAARSGRGVLVFNGGLSVSGLQHIGRLRGEVLLLEAVRRRLEERGYRVEQLITLYTQDPWKGKEEQLGAFKSREEARRYVGWPLIRVPDPEGCHDNWVEHYWEDFGPYLKEVGDGRIRVVTTTELYKGRLRSFITEKVLPLRREVIRVVNKYRGRKPYPEDWIPVEPVCGNCGRIDSTEALEVSGGRVRYRCRSCGYEGVARLEDSKLNWRIEWTGVWWSLGVDFEPYGKDHATPGGSRDSCADLAVNVFGFEPPEGEWYEWVSMRASGREYDMTSSGFAGVTPREWLEVAHPQVLRFIYFNTHLHRRIVIDMKEIPSYYSQYYRAERVYFGAEEGDRALARAYEFSHPRGPPREMPSQPPYLHVAILAQIVGPDNPEEAVRRLERTGHVRLDDYSLEWVRGLLARAYRWVEKYGGGQYRVAILERLGGDVASKIRHPDLLEGLARALSSLDEWSEERIRDAMVEFGRDLSPELRREFYRDFYLAFTGRPQGPRAAPLLSLLDKEFVVSRLKEASSMARSLRGQGGT